MRWVSALAGITLLLAGLLTPDAGEAGRLEWSVRYQGRTVRVHVITPSKGAGPWPLAMVLHGASGLGRGHLLWPMAQALADRGVAAAVVRYYDGLPARTSRKQSVHLFVQREKILDRVIGSLLRHNLVEGDKIGVFGYSLGGFHAIALAAKDNRIAAAVSLAGGLSGHISRPAVADAAPLMLIHGTGDRIVPYRRSRITRAVWQEAGQPVTLVSMRSAGHVPYGKAREHAFETAANFIAEELQMALSPPIPRARPVVPVPPMPPPPNELATAR